jgi:mannose-6-phosphate isomerase-like protein (cupin superfamily)
VRRAFGRDSWLHKKWQVAEEFYLRVSKPPCVPEHKHTFEQLVFCIQGRFNFYVDDELFLMTAGSMLRVPPNTLHYTEPIGDEVALNLDIFAPMREDYKHLVEYQDPEFGQNPTPAASV